MTWKQSSVIHGSVLKNRRSEPQYRDHIAVKNEVGGHNIRQKLQNVENQIEKEKRTKLK